MLPGVRDAVEILGRTLLDYHRAVIRPSLPHIGRRIAGVRDGHDRELLSGGTEALLASLPPLRGRYPRTAGAER